MDGVCDKNWVLYLR